MIQKNYREQTQKVDKFVERLTFFENNVRENSKHWNKIKYVEETGK